MDKLDFVTLLTHIHDASGKIAGFCGLRTFRWLQDQFLKRCGLNTNDEQVKRILIGAELTGQA